VEDDLSLQKLYEMMISTFGFRVVGKANNGKEAIEMYNALNKKPNVILMDHRMPVQNGLDTALILLKLKKPPKIIFTSADISIKSRALAIGGLTFLEKPFTVNALHDEIIKVLSISYFFHLLKPSKILPPLQVDLKEFNNTIIRKLHLFMKAFYDKFKIKQIIFERIKNN